MDIEMVILAFVWGLHFLVMASVMRRFGHSGMMVFVLPLVVALAQTWLIQAFVPGLTIGSGLGLDPTVVTFLAFIVTLGGWFMTRAPSHLPDMEDGSVFLGLAMCIPGVSVLAGLFGFGQSEQAGEVAITRHQMETRREMARETDAIWDQYEAQENRHGPSMRDDTPQMETRQDTLTDGGLMDTGPEADFRRRREDDDRDRIEL